MDTITSQPRVARYRRYRAPFSQNASDHIYKPYVDELLSIEKTIDPIFDVSHARPLQRSGPVDAWLYLRTKLLTTRERVFQLLRQMVDEGRNAVRGLRAQHRGPLRSRSTLRSCNRTI